ncbi:MAG: SDR family oxidoreductase [Sphingomonadales bacterium]|nr:SDR family oxidoreductase [Sphingomonadales bacterium]
MGGTAPGGLAGRSALVTGAGSGIGRATAARLRAEGARVYTVDLQGAVDRHADVTAPGINAEIVAEAAARHGGLDILVPCAGISAFHSLEGHDDGYFDQVIAVNLIAVFRIIRDAVPYLRQSRNGRIVAIGSTMARFGDAGLAAYGASKHAVLGLTRSVACELGPFGITANCVQPGAIETPMTEPAFTAMPEFKAYFEKKAPLGRLGQPEDVADVIALLCTDAARFMTGQGFFVDGGAMTRQ